MTSDQQPEQYADQRAHDVAWMTAAERSAMDEQHIDELDDLDYCRYCHTFGHATTDCSEQPELDCPDCRPGSPCERFPLCIIEAVHEHESMCYVCGKVGHCGCICSLDEDGNAYQVEARS